MSARMGNGTGPLCLLHHLNLAFAIIRLQSVAEFMELVGPTLGTLPRLGDCSLAIVVSSLLIRPSGRLSLGFGYTSRDLSA